MEGGNAIQESRKCLKTSVTFEPRGDRCDYISKLPDEILILILDKLPMEDAYPTCILSKRWVTLWRSKTIVEFDCNLGKKSGSIVFKAANHYMDHYLGGKIQRLSVSFRYVAYMSSSVNKWMRCAFEKNVEEICIDLNGLEKKTKRRKHSGFRLLPDCEIKCSTLVKLTLKFMKLSMLPTCITALKELYLEEVELAVRAVEKITTDCPSLLLLSLSNCNSKSFIKIQIAPKCNLLKLIINEMLGKVDNSTELYVQAPRMTMIEFASALPRRNYHVKDKPETNAVKFSLDQMRHKRRAVNVGRGGLRGREFVSRFFGLLQAFWRANVLCLSSWCIQVLGLKIMFCDALYSSEATHVVLATGLRRVEVIGLVHLLRACKGLKRLTIRITEPEELNFHGGLKNTYINGSRYAVLDFEGNRSYTETKDLPGLEVVEIKNHSADFEHDMCAQGNFFFDEARFLEGTECGVMALSLLKAKAKNLRKLVFESRKHRWEIDPRKGYGFFFSRI